MNMIHEAATTGTGKGVLGDTKEININSIDGGFALQDLTHKGQLSLIIIAMVAVNTV